MINKLPHLALVLTLAVLPLAAPVSAAPLPIPEGPATLAPAPAAAQEVPLFQALEWLDEAAESR
ncbi:hypothetical protein AB0G87_39175, partial [Streptomyces asoensis]|uniref:hypothetical protein n=1 Tax=Streptomyces asoensis TaxID=249586 RepID=UPI0033E58DBF